MPRHASAGEPPQSSRTAWPLRVARHLLCAATLALHMASPAHAQTTWVPMDLGTLGGTSLDSSVAEGINTRGDVVGWSTINGQAHAFLWTASAGMRDLGTLGGPSSAALAIDDAGQVVGWAVSAAGNRHAFVWTETTGMVRLDAVASGPHTQAVAINNQGLIVGTQSAPEGTAMFLTSTSTPGAASSSGTLGGPMQATGLNDAGTISCQGATPDGVMRPCAVVDRVLRRLLGTPPLPAAPAVGGAFAINNRGRIVGADATSALLWFGSSGTLAQRIAAPGIPSDINDFDQIVSTGNGHGFVWREGDGEVDLGAETGAMEISNRAEVVGYTTVDGRRHATIWRGPLSGVLLHTSHASPQRAGTTITLTAAAGGGTPPYSHRFWVQPWGGDWQLLRDWGPGATHEWTPTSGPGYAIWVQTRDSAAGDRQVQTGINFEISGEVTAGGPMTAIRIAADRMSPQPTGTAIRLTATGTGGTTPHMFRFWVQPWGREWQLLRDWGTASTHDWIPTGAGGYSVWVQGRSAGSSSVDVQTGFNFEIVVGSGGGGGGGTAPYTFRFWEQRWDGGWNVVRDWSAVDTFEWRPSIAGGYNVAVEARSAGATAAEVQARQNFVIRP